MNNFNSIGLFVNAIGRVSADGVSLLGTGFAVADGRIATAAHVIGHNENGLVAILPKVANVGMTYQDTTDLEIQVTPVKIFAFNPVRDIAILELTTVGIRFPALGSTDNVLPGMSIITHGYPHADTGRFVLTQYGGIIGARVLLGNGGVKTKHIVLNIQTRPGQSGSPVVAQNVVCAMLVGAYRAEGNRMNLMGIDPSTLHQTTHAVSAEYIKEML